LLESLRKPDPGIRVPYELLVQVFQQQSATGFHIEPLDNSFDTQLSGENPRFVTNIVDAVLTGGMPSDERELRPIFYREPQKVIVDTRLHYAPRAETYLFRDGKSPDFRQRSVAPSSSSKSRLQA
jgi:hypothetical protein